MDGSSVSPLTGSRRGLFTISRRKLPKAKEKGGVDQTPPLLLSGSFAYGYQMNRALYCHSRPECVASWLVMRPKLPLLTSVEGMAPMKLFVKL